MEFAGCSAAWLKSQSAQMTACYSADAYRRARDAEIVNRSAIARFYNRNPADIIVINHDAALAIKVSFPRPQSSGSKRRQRCGLGTR